MKNEGLVVSALLRAPGPAELRLTYDVTGARWEPAYDVHLDPRSDQVTVSLWAAVQQATGEDWPGVELTVSTAAPTTPVLPELPAWRIGERELFTPITQVKATHRPRARAGAPRADADLVRAAAQALEGTSSSDVPLKQPSQQSFDLDIVETMPAHAPAPGYGRIFGYVFDQSGNPLAGVSVRAEQRPAHLQPLPRAAFRSRPSRSGQYRAAAPRRPS